MISVIVLIYNSEFNDIIKTLESIKEQKFEDYEIIIADDASSITYDRDIKNYFSKHKITNYKIIKQKKNKGTVANYIDALMMADGAIVKPISPGDMLYDKDSLKNMQKFILEKNCDFAFGKIMAYKKNTSMATQVPFYAPKDLFPYRVNNMKRIKRNIILYADFISGACMFGKRRAILQELLKISNTVKYCEDFIQIQLILSGISFCFMDEYVVMYENSQGISRKKQTGKSLVQIDYENLIEMLHNENDDNLLKKRYRLNKYNNKNNKLVKVICKFMCSPSLYWVSMKHKLRKINNKGY